MKGCKRGEPNVGICLHRIFFWVSYKFVLLIICTICPLRNINSQNVKWAISGGGIYEQNICDFHFAQGSSFIVGYYDAWYDAVFGKFTIPQAPSDIARVGCFAASCDTLSNWKWASGGGGSYISNSIAVTSDENNNAYITGFSGRDLLYANMLFPAIDCNFAPVYLAKHDRQGNLKWLKRFGQQMQINTLSDGSGTGLVYKDGYIYVLGSILSGGIFYNTYLAPPNIYLAKFDTLGNFKWAKYIARDETYNLHSSRLTFNNSNNILITGLFNYKIVVGNDTLKNDSYNFNYNSFFCEADTSGNVLFARKVTESLSQVEIIGIISDKDDNIFLTGAFRDTLKIDSTLLLINKDEEYDGFILKMNDRGEVIWGKQLEGSGEQISVDLAIRDKELFCTGYFTNEITINNIKGYSSGYEDIFLIKMNADNGDLLTGYIFGGEESSDITAGIELDGKKNIYLAGTFINQTVFGNKVLRANFLEDIDVFVFCFDEYGTDSAIDENTLSGNSIKIYPNPAKDFLIIESQEVNLPVLIEIYDMNGKILYNSILNNPKELIYRENIGINNKGVYLVRLSGNGFQKIEKLILE
jgi:hypothetical protein